MNRTVILTLFVLSTMLFSYHGQATTPVDIEPTPQIFFIDRRLHRLISIDFQQSGSCERICREMVNSLISGRDKNDEILRILPYIPHSVTVKVDGNTACVDLSGELSRQIAKNQENEKLVIYQIVNSLTSIDGINTVTFTIDGKCQKSFLGFLDMREIFTPNYDI